MIFIRVRERVYVPTRDLPASALLKLRKAFTHDNPAYAKQRARGYRKISEPATYQTWYRVPGDPENTWTLPRGGMSRVRAILREECLPFLVTDDREKGGGFPWCNAYEIPDSKLKFRGYQLRSIDALIAKENALLRAPTGSGKTSTLIGVIARLKVPTLVTVWSGNLMEQWVNRVQSELGLDASQVGIIREGKAKLLPITIGMQQTIANVLEKDGPIAEEILSGFSCFAMDEVQRAAAATYFACVDPFPSKYRFGVSADETRRDAKEFLTRDLFGNVAYQIERDELIESGDILDVEVRVIPTEFRAPWYARDPDFDKILRHMMSDEARNALAIQWSMFEVNAGEQVLLTSHRVEHCRLFDQELARSGAKSGLFLGGKDNSSQFEETRQKLLSGDYRAAVGTIQAVGQGLDIPRLSRLVVSTPVASNRQAENQLKGRICRTSDVTGKTNARYYYLWDIHVYGMKPLQNLVRWNRDVKVLQCDGGWLDGKKALSAMRSARARS